MNITHISVSRKGVWDLCQQQYKYKYHLKLESDAEEPVYFLYGTIVHKVAQEYVAARGERPITEVAQDLLSGAIDLEEGKKCPPIPAEYKKKFPEHLRNIQKLTEQTGFDGELEYNFSYDLDPPHRRNIYGFIDRLIVKGDKAWILDYKTTKQGWWRKGPKDIVNDLQLRAYARVVQKKFKIKPENIACALYYLEGGELVGARFTEASLAAAEQELLQAYIDIQNADPDKVWGRVGEHCKRCEYRKVCPFYSLT